MAEKITTIEHLKALATTVEGFTANLVGEVAGTAAEAIEAVEGTAVNANTTAETAQTNVEALQKDVGILADNDKHILAALNLYMTTTQAEMRELKNLVSTMQAQISALSS